MGTKKAGSLTSHPSVSPKKGAHPVCHFCPACTSCAAAFAAWVLLAHSASTTRYGGGKAHNRIGAPDKTKSPGQPRMVLSAAPSSPGQPMATTHPFAQVPSLCREQNGQHKKRTSSSTGKLKYSEDSFCQMAVLMTSIP